MFQTCSILSYTTNEVMEIIGVKMQVDHAQPSNRVEPDVLFPEINANEDNVEDDAVHQENDSHGNTQHCIPTYTIIMHICFRRKKS